MGELNKFCRKCGRKLLFNGRREFTDDGITFNPESGESDVAQIYSCPKSSSWFGGDLHDEYRIRERDQLGYYYY